jgi:hypothetical protein
LERATGRKGERELERKRRQRRGRDAGGAALLAHHLSPWRTKAHECWAAPGSLATRHLSLTCHKTVGSGAAFMETPENEMERDGGREGGREGEKEIKDGGREGGRESQREGAGDVERGESGTQGRAARLRREPPPRRRHGPQRRRRHPPVPRLPGPRGARPRLPRPAGAAPAAGAVRAGEAGADGVEEAVELLEGEDAQEVAPGALVT